MDGELPDNELAEVEAHLGACTGCAEFRVKIEQSITPHKRPQYTLPWIRIFAAAGSVALLLIAGGLERPPEEPS